jgi:hypothetical protein
MIRSPADIVSVQPQMPARRHMRVRIRPASVRALPRGRGIIEQAVLLWMTAACLQVAECRGQVFGGCDCAGPMPPKPAAQLDAERQQIVGELDGMHDSRESLIADHARKTARQLEVSVLMRLPAARLIEAKLELGQAQLGLAAAIELGLGPGQISTRQVIVRDRAERVAQIEAELLAYQNEIESLEAQKRELFQEAEQLRFNWIGALSVVNRDEFVADRLKLLDAEIQADPDFADGYLYRTLLNLQQGDVVQARSDIRKARELMYGTTSTLNVRFKTVFQPAQIVDMVYACLLLGQEKPAWNYVEICRQRYPQFVNHPVYLHMKAKYEECENSFSTAGRLYEQAIKQIEGWGANAPKESYNAEELYADAAWFFSACPSDSVRDVAKAKVHAETALQMTNCKSWTAWRAIANTQASAGEWATAADALERCRHYAPQHLGPVFDEQENAYRNNRIYLIPRRKK